MIQMTIMVIIVISGIRHNNFKEMSALPFVAGQPRACPELAEGGCLPTCRCDCLRLSLGSEGQRQQRFLLYLMCLGAAGCRAGAGTALH